MTPLQKYATVFGAGLLLAVMLAASYGTGRRYERRWIENHPPKPDTITVVKTTKEKNPEISSFKPLRTVWIPLPVKPDSSAKEIANSSDTATVAVPIPPDINTPSDTAGLI